LISVRLENHLVANGAPFGSSDGFVTNTTKALHLSLDCFANSEVATFKSEGLPGMLSGLHIQLSAYIPALETRLLELDHRVGLEIWYDCLGSPPAKIQDRT
jgi:hypothetical protein